MDKDSISGEHVTSGVDEVTVHHQEYLFTNSYYGSKSLQEICGDMGIDTNSITISCV